MSPPEVMTGKQGRTFVQITVASFLPARYLGELVFTSARG